MYNTSDYYAEFNIYSPSLHSCSSSSVVVLGRTILETTMARSKEEIKAYKKAWHEANKERRNIASAEYYLKNKVAIAKKAKEYRRNNKEKIKAKKSTPAYKEYIAQYLKDYVKRPEQKVKHAARTKVSKAVLRGKLIKLPCEICGNPESEGHHDDYSKPLEVRWLCKKHHTEHHQNMEKTNEQ